jgi:hypothetical protein
MYICIYICINVLGFLLFLCKQLHYLTGPPLYIHTPCGDGSAGKYPRTPHRVMAHCTSLVMLFAMKCIRIRWRDEARRGDQSSRACDGRRAEVGKRGMGGGKCSVNLGQRGPTAMFLEDRRIYEHGCLHVVLDGCIYICINWRSRVRVRIC